MTLYKWLQASGSNASVDSTINWAEGQAPSTVNDSARAMMAAVAKYRDDIAGAIVTAGTSTAYTVSSYEVFDTLAHLNGQVVAFTPHVTNGATVTLNVDSLGAKPLRSAPNVEIFAGTLVQGTPYIATYNNSDGAFYLHGFYGASAYLIPLGGIIDYTGTTAPNSNFVLPFGQAISRTTYAPYFAMVSTTFGTGDGSTTFNVPDLRGRVIAGKDDMGGLAAGVLGSIATDNGTITGATMGSKGGSPSHVLTTGEIPAHNHGVADPGHNHKLGIAEAGDAATAGVGAQSDPLPQYIHVDANFTSQSATTGITINNAGGGGAHAMLQPTIILNKILRVI